MWTVRGEALGSILNNYVELMNLWDWSIDTLPDTEMKARIRDTQANMLIINFVFGCCLGILLLKQTGNLSRTLRNPKMSASEGNAITQNVIKTLSNDHNDYGGLLMDGEGQILVNSMGAKTIQIYCN